MQKNGCDDASTIHSMIYIPIVNEKTGEVTFKLNRKSTIADAKLIIIDECSMVNNKMGEDLLSFGVPILVLGDPAQLPPVDGSGFFTSGEPDSMLTEIHRQASENPIIYMASRIRNQDMLEYGEYGESSVTNKLRKADVFASDQMISGKNSTRVHMNGVFREHFGYKGNIPLATERVICLKNENDIGMLNGEMYEVMEVTDKNPALNYFNMVVSSKDNDEKSNLKIRPLRYLFDGSKEPEHWKMKLGRQQMTYGYCLTAHKSQGSQWDSVYIIDESEVFRDMWWRWLYTAITRASEKVTIYM